MPSGTDEEFVEFVSARLARLHRAAHFMCGDPHRADDLVQATLVSLYSRWKHAQSAENLDGYVHRILFRRFIDEKRSKWSRVVLWDRLPEAPDRSGDASDDRNMIVAALRKLPVGQRAVVVLRYYSDLSVEQTAKALGCSTGNVKSQCARGLASLRTALSATESTSTDAPTTRRPQALTTVARAHGR
jgi:RNA polymerase sigma-70 factor (sigma-E family)